MDNPNVVARLTVTRGIGWKTIIEVHQDATFHNFYRYYKQFGNKRSTKQFVRFGHRNQGIEPWYATYRITPGLELLAAKWQERPNVTAVKLRIIKKKIYRRRINEAPVGLAVIKTVNLKPTVPPLPIPIEKMTFRLIDKRNKAKLHAGSVR